MKILRLFFQVIRQDRLLILCSIFFLTVVILAFIGVYFTGYTYFQTSKDSLLPPNARHWCGTDINGRDLLTRMLYGAQISLMVAAIGTVVSLLIGVTYGMISGYVGGRIDNLMMRLVDIFYSLPNLVLVIVFVTTLESSAVSFLNLLHLRAWINPRLFLLIIFLGITQWLSMARVIRGQVLVLRQQQFIQASEALGQSHFRILWLHLLPNLSGIIMIYLTLTIPAIMLDESILSFLGLGTQAPLASWGTLVSEGASLINPIRSFWWMLVFPASLMTLTLLALNFLGDGLRDTLDPRFKK